MKKDLKENVALDNYYYSFSKSDNEDMVYEEDKKETYNYKLLELISGRPREVLVEFLGAIDADIKIKDSLIIPKSIFIDGLERYEVEKKRKDILLTEVSNASSDDLKDKDIDSLQAYFQNASTQKKREFFTMVRAGEVKALEVISRAIKEIETDDNNRLTFKNKYHTRPTSLFLSEDLDLVIIEAQMQKSLKPRGYWSDIGVSFSKEGSVKAFDSDGKEKQVKIRWVIKHDSSIIERI